jgi:hypothetical protein
MIMKETPLVVYFVTLVLISGCMPEMPGSNTSLEFDKFYVAPAQNDSLAPQAQALLTRNIRTKLANHSGWSIAVSPENAAVLEIANLDRRESIATLRSDDTLRAKSFDMTMSVICTLSNSKTDRVYFQNDLSSDWAECYSLTETISQPSAKSCRNSRKIHRQNMYHYL